MIALISIMINFLLVIILAYFQISENIKYANIIIPLIGIWCLTFNEGIQYVQRKSYEEPILSILVRIGLVFISIHCFIYTIVTIIRKL